jgi:hypothetical protein
MAGLARKISVEFSRNQLTLCGVMKIPLNQLLAFTKQATFSAAINAGRWDAREIPFTDTTGFHTYADLDLALELSAGDDQASYRNLQVLQALASAAEAVGRVSGMRILEIQGQRLHLYLEAQIPREAEVRKLVQACRVFYQLATAEIGRLIGDTPFSIRMASDHGRAILLRSTGDDASESLVSLGNAANRPAKKLARAVGEGGVPAGYLALNEGALRGSDEPRWQLINLDLTRVQKQELDEAAEDAQARLTMFSAANSQYSGLAKSAMEVMAREFEPNPQNPVHAPLRRVGFMFRADLDGHSVKVRAAMDRGDHAIAALVANFHQIMRYPVAFKESLPGGVSVLCFPWAGDCANLFLECDDYRLERTYLPNTAALNWHTQNGESGIEWRRVLEDCKWLVALGGGDPVSAGRGTILTGNVTADGRTFHVGAGWSWRRSLDAEQSKGTKAEDTIIQVEDYRALDGKFQAAYADHPENPSLFKLAPLASLERAARQSATATCVSVAATEPVFNIQVRAPKPYCGQ